MRYFLIILFLLIPLYGFTNDPLKKEETPGPKLKDIIWATKPVIKKEKDDKKVFFKISGHYKDQTGNNDSLETGGESEFKFFDGIRTFKFGFNFTFNKNYNTDISKREVTEHKGYGWVNFDHFLHKRWELFVFSLHEYDIMANLYYRNYTGAGPKYIILNNDYVLLDISYAPTFQYEKHVFNKTEDYINYKWVKKTYRFVHSFRGRIDIYFWKKLKFQFFCYYIPFYDFSHFRIILETSLSTTITDLKITKKSGIEFKVGYRREYNSKVPLQTNKIDSIIFSSLGFFI